MASTVPRYSRLRSTTTTSPPDAGTAHNGFADVCAGDETVAVVVDAARVVDLVGDGVAGAGGAVVLVGNNGSVLIVVGSVADASNQWTWRRANALPPFNTSAWYWLPSNDTAT